MKTRIIQTKIWNDDFFWELTPAEKLSFIYYIANPAITILHVYECPDRKALYDLKIQPEDLTSAKNKFQVAGKIHFFEGWVYITNASRYQEYRGTSNDVARLSLIRQLPKGVLDWYYGIKDTGVGTTQTVPKTTIAIETKIETTRGGYGGFQQVGENLKGKNNGTN